MPRLLQMNTYKKSVLIFKYIIRMIIVKNIKKRFKDIKPART